MAMTYDRDVLDAIWHATDSIGNRLQNDSLLINKAKTRMENLKNRYYDYGIEWDKAHGLGEQKRHVWDDWNLCELKLPKNKPATKIPTREEIEKKIKVYVETNIERHERVRHYEYTCEDGYKIHSECKSIISVCCSYDEIDAKLRAQNMARKDVVQKALKHYIQKHYTEVCNMTTMQFEKFDTALKAMHGNLSIELNGMDEMDDIAHIDVPLNYLKYFDIKMPTTDFCVSKRKDTGNWIEGLPAIKKIETYNDRVTKVTFIDETFTKAVCSENDYFDLDTGITICYMKRLLGKNGNKRYNNIIRYAHKVIDENNKNKEEEAKKKAEARMKERDKKLKKAAKELRAKEEYIDIQAQAIIRAHEELEARANEKA